MEVNKNMDINTHNMPKLYQSNFIFDDPGLWRIKPNNIIYKNKRDP